MLHRKVSKTDAKISQTLHLAKKLKLANEMLHKNVSQTDARKSIAKSS